MGVGGGFESSLAWMTQFLEKEWDGCQTDEGSNGRIGDGRLGEQEQVGDVGHGSDRRGVGWGWLGELWVDQQCLRCGGEVLAGTCSPPPTDRQAASLWSQLARTGNDLRFRTVL